MVDTFFEVSQPLQKYFSLSEFDPFGPLTFGSIYELQA